jgi:uncharacterized protein
MPLHCGYLISMSETSFRYDLSPIEKYEVTPEGYLRAWATIARTGIQSYVNADGSMRREYRPEDEVSSGESLASFASKVITDEHPPELLDSDNTSKYQKGFTGSEIVYDNGFVKAVMTVTDKSLISKIMRGDMKEVSAGYRVEFDSSPGITPEGEHYDGTQRNISGNHVAVVRRGRAGPDVKLHLDRMDAAHPSLISTQEETLMTAQVNFDGVSFEVSEGIATAIAKEREDGKATYEDMKKKYDAMMANASKMKEEMDAMEKDMKGKCDAAEGRADALAQELEAVRADLEAAKEVNFDSMVEERLALIDKARLNLDSAFDFTGKPAREIMEAAIKNVRGDAAPDLSERSDDYVQAMFDTLQEGRADSSSTTELRKTVASLLTPVAAPSSYMEKLQNGWKTPLTATKER